MMHGSPESALFIFLSRCLFYLPQFLFFYFFIFFFNISFVLFVLVVCSAGAGVFLCLGVVRAFFCLFFKNLCVRRK